MSDTIERNRAWKMVLPIMEARKSLNAEGDEVMIVRGLASGVAVDLEHERMAETAIAAMQRCINNGIDDPQTGEHTLVPLRSEHSNRWDDVLGWITRAEVDDEHNLWIEAELDSDNPTAVNLWKKLTGKTKSGRVVKLGLSVAGYVKAIGREWSDALQKQIVVYRDLLMTETSVVGAPAYAPAYVEALTKSIVKQGTDWRALELEDSFMDKDITKQTEQVATHEATDAAVTSEAAEAAAPAATEAVIEAEQVATTDSGDAEAVETDAAAIETEKSGEGDAVDVAKDVETDAADVVEKASAAEDAMNAALLESAKAAMDEISNLVSSFQMLRYEVDFVLSTLMGKGMIAEADLAKARAGETVEVVAKAEDAAIETEPEAEVAKAAADGDAVVKAADLAEILKGALADALAPIVERIETIESTPIDKSISVARQKIEEAEDVVTKFNREVGDDRNPRRMLAKAAAISREMNGID